MRIWRVYHPDPAPGADLVLDETESRHLTRVLRLGAGDRVRVFDGNGREWEATVVDPSRSAATVRLGEERTDRVEPDLRLTLYQGACRPDRFEWVVQKATEIGVHAVVPVITSRSEEVRGGESRLDRCRRIATEAAKQSGRRCVPRIEEARAIDDVGPGPDGGVVLHASDATPIGAILARPAPGRFAILVGPEGGLDDHEVGAAERRGWTPASLGPRTLRTETAGLVAAVLTLHAWDDLGRFEPGD